MPCTVCQHPQRRDIDQALIAGSATLAALSQQYNLSTSALHRHKAHLQAKVNQAKDRLQDNLRQGCLFWLSQALQMTMQTAKAAQNEGNGKIALQAIRQGTRLITIILKQDFQPDPEMVYEILASPQWTAQDSLLPDDPRILSASRQALAGVLSTPCPDTAAAPASLNPQPNLDLFQENLLSLAQPPENGQRQTANGLLTDNRLVKPREKSGKLPGYSECFITEAEEYRLVEMEKKIAQLDLDALTRGLPPDAANAKIDAIFQELYNSIPIPKPLSEYLHDQSLSANQADPKPRKNAARTVNRPENGNGTAKLAA